MWKLQSIAGDAALSSKAMAWDSSDARAQLVQWRSLTTLPSSSCAEPATPQRPSAHLFVFIRGPLAFTRSQIKK